MCIVVALEYADYFSRVVMSYSFSFFRCSAAYRFLFDGNRVNDTDTPESLEMVRCVLPAWVFLLRCPCLPAPPHGGFVSFCPLAFLLVSRSRPASIATS